MSGDIQILTDDIVQWANEVFPDRDTSSALLKLFEEVGELVRDPSSPGEYADICIMLFDLAHMHNVDLSKAIEKKMQINKARSWRVTETGTLQHVGSVSHVQPDVEAPIVSKEAEDKIPYFLGFAAIVAIATMLGMFMSWLNKL